MWILQNLNTHCKQSARMFFFILPNSVVTIYTICCNICDTLHFDHTVYTCASVTMWRNSKILYLWHQYRSPVFTQFNQIKNPLIYITWQEYAPLVKQTSVVVIANPILSCTRKRDHSYCSGTKFDLQWQGIQFELFPKYQRDPPTLLAVSLSRWMFGNTVKYD